MTRLLKPSRACIAALLLLALPGVPLPQASAQSGLEDVIVQFGGYLLGEIIKETLQKTIVDPVSTAAANALTGRGTSDSGSDVARIKRDLDQLAQGDREHAAAIRQLQYALDERMTREQVNSLLMSALEQVDRRFASLARSIADQGYEMNRLSGRLDRVARDLGITRSELAKLELSVANHQARLDDHDRTFMRHEGRLTRQDQIIAEVRREYPRWNPSVQSGELGAAAYASFLRGDYRRSLEDFRYAHAYDPTEPAFLYGQAYTHYCLGEHDAARDVVARAVVAERTRPLPRWYARVSERIQGPHRDFIEAARHHATRGVFVPGNHRSPVMEVRR